MGAALLAMWQVYPVGWKDFTAYKPLAEAIENYYSDMGLIYSKLGPMRLQLFLRRSSVVGTGNRTASRHCITSSTFSR